MRRRRSAHGAPSTRKGAHSMSLRRYLRALSVALTVAAILAATLAVSATAGPAKGTAAAGKAIFMTKCIACHKKDGTGGFKVTGNPTPNWTLKKTWDATRTDDYLRDCITNGKLKSGMVAWGKTGQVKPQQVEDLITFIKTFKAAGKELAQLPIRCCESALREGRAFSWGARSDPVRGGRGRNSRGGFTTVPRPPRGSAVVLRERPHVREHARVDRVDDRVAPQRPVAGRPHVERVPRPAFEPRASFRQRDEPELATTGTERTREMRRRESRVGTPFGHRGGLRFDVERQPRRRLPRSDRFDERSGRELAAPNRAHPGAGDRRAARIGDPEAEEPARGLVELAERDDVPPHDVGRSIHDRARAHLAQRRFRARQVGERQSGREEQHERAHGRATPGLQRDRPPGDRPGDGDDARERERHRDAERPFDREQEHRTAGEDQRQQRDEDRLALRTGVLAVEHPGGDRSQQERRDDEQRRAIAAQHERLDGDHGRAREQADDESLQRPPQGLVVSLLATTSPCSAPRSRPSAPGSGTV